MVLSNCDSLLLELNTNCLIICCISPKIRAYPVNFPILLAGLEEVVFCNFIVLSVSMIVSGVINVYQHCIDVLTELNVCKITNIAEESKHVLDLFGIH